VKGKRVLVTGGAGFIGSNLVRRLCEMGARVTVLDDMSSGKLDNLAGLDYTLQRGSVVDAPTINAMVKDNELVFHIAARNIIVSTSNPRSDFETNIGGMLNVLLAAREFGARVVYTSSASVYGNASYMPVCEDALPNLLSPYAVSKHAGEGYCNAFCDMWNVPVSVIRLSNVYGTNQRADNPYCGVVAKFMQTTMDGKSVHIHGDGAQTRDFTYIDDAIDAIIEAAVNPRAIGETFNVGTGIETNVNALADFIIGLNGSYIKPEHIERRDIDNVTRRALNINKARRVLKWYPKVTLKDGLLRTWEWMHGN